MPVRRTYVPRKAARVYYPKYRVTSASGRAPATRPRARKSTTAGQSRALGRAIRSGGAGIGRSVGGAFAGPPGAYVGGALGDLVGSSIAHFTGLGRYDVSKIRKNVFLHDPPVMQNAKMMEGATVIRHREYLGDIVSSSSANTFNIQGFSLNPAQSKSFPWASAIAEQFEEYAINGMVWEFKSTASDAIASSTNLALGEVILATQYDPIDDPFSSNVEMLNYEFAQSCKVSESALHMIECDPRQSPMTHLYTRPGAQPANTDLRLYDFGTFYIATNGLQGTSVTVGQLWVTYEFLFYKPKVSQKSEIIEGSFVAVNNSNIVWFGGNGIAVADNSLGIDYSTTNVIKFPVLETPQTFLVSLVYEYTDDVPVAWVPPTTTLVNCTLISLFDDFLANHGEAPESGEAVQNTSLTYLVSMTPAQVQTGIQSTITFSAGTHQGSSPQATWAIAPMAYYSP